MKRTNKDKDGDCGCDNERKLEAWQYCADKLSHRLGCCDRQVEQEAEHKKVSCFWSQVSGPVYNGGMKQRKEN